MVLYQLLIVPTATISYTNSLMCSSSQASLMQQCCRVSAGGDCEISHTTSVNCRSSEKGIYYIAQCIITSICIIQLYAITLSYIALQWKDEFLIDMHSFANYQKVIDQFDSTLRRTCSKSLWSVFTIRSPHIRTDVYYLDGRTRSQYFAVTDTLCTNRTRTELYALSGFSTVCFESVISGSWVLLDTQYETALYLHQQQIFTAQSLDQKIDNGGSWWTLASCLPFDSCIIYCAITCQVE